MGFSFKHILKILICLLLLLKITKAQEACRTPAFESGFCVPYSECPFANQLTQTYGSYNAIPQHFLEFLQKSKCSTQDQAIRLCCKIRNYNPKRQNTSPAVAVANVDRRSTADLDYTQNYISQLNTQGLNILDELSCGKPDNNRVVGGNETQLGEYPWMALLRSDAPDSEFHCGGSLITNNFVLTAAHCVNKPTSPVIGVRLGEHDLDTVQDCRYKGTRKICNPPVQDLDVEYTIIHPEFSEANKINDIALIKLKQNAKIQNHIKPVCLPITQKSFDQKINDFFIAGWGHTETSGKRNSKVLLKAQVSRKDPSICEKNFPIILNQKHICAGDLETGRDTCKGDSGGPLVSLNTYKTVKRFIQYGIVAAGGSACSLSQELPGVYTNIITYMPWITSNIF